MIGQLRLVDVDGNVIYQEVAPDLATFQQWKTAYTLLRAEWNQQEEPGYPFSILTGPAPAE